MHETATRVEAGWYPDSARPDRTRWWDGEHWTARVLDNGDETISWAATIVEQPPPMVSVVDGDLVIDLTGVGEVDDLHVEIDVGPNEEPTENLVLLFGGAPGVHVPSRFVAPAPQSLLPLVRLRPARLYREAELRLAPPAAQPEPVAQLAPRRSTRRRLVAIAAAAVVVLGAAAGAAVILDASASSGETQPIHTRSYRDAGAGFELQYPRSWRVHDADSGTGVQFSVGGVAEPVEANTVTVLVGDEAAKLPLLNDLAEHLTDQYRAEHPTITFDSGTRTKLDGAEALRIKLSDAAASPGLRIEQYVGTTTDGRSLTVTFSVRDLATAPSARSVRGFVRSIHSP